MRRKMDSVRQLVSGRRQSSTTLPETNTLHQMKVMVSVWWSSADLINRSFLKPGETITADNYCNEINLHINRRHWPIGKAQVFHTTMLDPHISMITRQKLRALGYGTLFHLPYSPELSPTDYHFLKLLDNFLLEKCFRNPRDAKTAFSVFVASRTAEFYNIDIKKLVSQ
ncbi:histone-lysine N-methyltransferase SETMAR [Trichonephila clavipes]|nr:histone-lysine N-methyltransferase SETMAR [Trichonephila clavipes]